MPTLEKMGKGSLPVPDGLEPNDDIKTIDEKISQWERYRQDLVSILGEITGVKVEIKDSPKLLALRKKRDQLSVTLQTSCENL